MTTTDPPVKLPHEDPGPTEKKLPPWPVDDDDVTAWTRGMHHPTWVELCQQHLERFMMTVVDEAKRQGLDGLAIVCESYALGLGRGIGDYFVTSNGRRVTPKFQARTETRGDSIHFVMVPVEEQT